MRFKVELHKDVVWFIRRGCAADEAKEFYAWLERLRDDPIAGTEVFVDKKLAPYALRYFRFGRNIGVFRLDAVRQKVIVRQCRKFRGEPTRRKRDTT